MKMASLDREKLLEALELLHGGGWTHGESLMTVHHPSLLQLRSRIALMGAPDERLWMSRAMDLAFMAAPESYGLHPLSPVAMEGLVELFGKRSEVATYWAFLREPNHELWRLLSKQSDVAGTLLAIATDASVIMRMAVLQCTP